jgi:endonuclease/exonuclease/phosphatase family metal-dependent hydrolase
VKLRVVTWNVHSCIGTDGRLDPARVASVLSDLEADVIGLQEVDSRQAHPTGHDQLPFLAERLGMYALAGPNLRDDRGELGNGLLTRVPPSSHELIDLSVAGFEARGAIDARLPLELAGLRLRVLVTHLGLTGAERAIQVGALREHIERGSGFDAMLLLGDFNEWRPRPFAGPGLAPSPFPVSSRVRAFPSRLPVLRLDRLLAWPEPRRFEVRAIRARPARIASDHLPIVADVEWGDGAAPGRA